MRMTILKSTASTFAIKNARLARSLAKKDVMIVSMTSFTKKNFRKKIKIYNLERSGILYQ